MNLNKLREHVREFLDQLVIQWMASLLICLDDVCALFRRERKRGERLSNVEKPRDGDERAGKAQEAGQLERVLFDDGDQFVLVHLLDPLIITCVRFSPDGRSLAYASSDGTVTILDLKSARSLCVFRAHRDWVTSVDWDPTGERLASASLDGTVQVWWAESGRTLFPPIVHHSEVRAVAWSPDGARLATTGADHQIWIWPIGEGGDGIVTCAGHTGQVRALAWSPCGMQLASASKDWSVRLWDTGSGNTFHTWWHDGPVNAVAWSPDPERGLVASGSDDRLVRVWNTRTGKCDFTYTGHRDYAGISACAWSRPARIISADWNLTIQEWTRPCETQKALVSIVIPRPRVPLLDTGYIHTLAAHTTVAGTRLALGGDCWMTIGASPAEPRTMLGDSSGGRVVLRP